MTTDAHLASPTCHLFFCPVPKVRAFFWCPATKSLDSPNWHWLILAPMGANGYDFLDHQGALLSFNFKISNKLTKCLGLHWLLWSLEQPAPQRPAQLRVNHWTSQSNQNLIKALSSVFNSLQYILSAPLSKSTFDFRIWIHLYVLDYKCQSKFASCIATMFKV